MDNNNKASEHERVELLLMLAAYRAFGHSDWRVNELARKHEPLKNDEEFQSWLRLAEKVLRYYSAGVKSRTDEINRQHSTQINEEIERVTKLTADELIKAIDSNRRSNELLLRLEKKYATDKRMEWWRIALVFGGTVISIGAAFGMFDLILTSYGNKPTSNLEVTYDIGNIAEAILLGAAALIASLTYAVRRTEPPRFQG